MQTTEDSEQFICIYLLCDIVRYLLVTIHVCKIY